MKKGLLYFSLALNVLLLIILLVCGLLLTKTRYANTQETKATNTPEAAVDVNTLSPEETATYKPQPITLEWMTLEEKNSFGINTSTPSRIQILKREANGQIEVYKIIKTDSDILKEF